MSNEKPKSESYFNTVQRLTPTIIVSCSEAYNKCGLDIEIAADIIITQLHFQNAVVRQEFIKMLLEIKEKNPETSLEIILATSGLEVHREVNTLHKRIMTMSELLPQTERTLS